MGYLPIQAETGDVYDRSYFAKYEGYAATRMGREITWARGALLGRHVPAGVTLCDVGIGCGDFIRGYLDRPDITAFGYDINPAGVAWLNERNAFRDPRVEPVDVLTFWDSIEHIADPTPFLRGARWVLCSLPIVPGDGPPAPDWKHLRPEEHCWYWTHAGFLAWMAAQGFHCVEASLIETELGREDIGTFAFQREN